MEKHSKIYLAGHTGLAGSAILKELQEQGYTNLITKTHNKLDLLNYEKVNDFFYTEKPEYVILAAAKVGGIHANTAYPAEFIYENLQIQNNVIHCSYLNKVKKLFFLGSSCVYPRKCHQPMKEEYLLTGELEPTNEPYAIAKIAGIRMCQSYNKQYGTNYISVIPSNVYGINDNFDPNNSHVIPSLICRIHHAKSNNFPYVTIWGTGESFREFLFSSDLAKSCIFLLKNYSSNELINIGSGKDLTINELAKIICTVIEYKGRLQFDITKPDGMFRKLVDITKLSKLGWEPKVSLIEGLKITYEWYIKNKALVSK